MIISKDFIDVAKVIARASKDPSSQVGCVIVDENNRIVSTGFNGMVCGADESELWSPREMKYETVIHAEMNALLYARKDLRGHSMYVTHAPCVNCLKHSLQSGIKKIVYENDSIMKRTSENSNRGVLKLLEATGMRYNVISTDNVFYYHSVSKHLGDV
jgi:dCMP deaminase